MWQSEHERGARNGVVFALQGGDHAVRPLDERDAWREGGPRVAAQRPRAGGGQVAGEEAGRAAAVQAPQRLDAPRRQAVAEELG